MRQQLRRRRQLGEKIGVPVFFLHLPSLFVVTVGPVVMRIIRELIPMMNNM
jgi:tight adherence protein C